MRDRHAAARTAFRELHRSGCFVMPNPWDPGSARALASLGFRALATTSAGFAFSRARPDHPRALEPDAVIAHVRDLVEATPLPVSADFQAGYADDAEGVGAHVAACLRTGCAGLSLEDATGDPSAPLFDRDEALGRLAAACAARDATAPDAVITARCEAWLVGDRYPLRTARDRLVAFAERGADCLFAPGVRDPGDIAALVAAVAPKPLNVLVSSPDRELSVARLADLGVRRVSVGSALARVAWAAFLHAARELADRGVFDGFAGAAAFAELDGLFGGGG